MKKRFLVIGILLLNFCHTYASNNGSDTITITPTYTQEELDIN